MREIYCIVIFFILKGLLNPTFEEFSYFFLLNVIGISKFMFALLVLIGNICHVVGALFYKAFCRSVDTRWMVLFAMLVQIVATFLNFCFAKRWNLELGISDLVFLLFTDIVFSVVGTLLYTLPIMALFAKITPAKIEGTIFAFLTGTMNLASSVISPGMGTFINHQFVGVNKKNLSNYSTLCLIAFIGSILTLTLLPLIPTKEQIVENRAERRKAELERRQRRRDRRAAKKMNDPEMSEQMNLMMEDG
jgi:Na+/melibiose symporter-like transporter